MSCTTLVTGGVRCGKSRFAEGLLHRAAEGGRAVYVATGPQRDDADWARRVRLHQERRPATWSTLETTDLASALHSAEAPMLVDCLGTWLTAQLDDLAAWDADEADWTEALQRRIDDVLAAWSVCSHEVVAVTNEVGWGVVSQYRSGRLFADWLGRLNQQVAQASDRVVLVVAGQPLAIKGDLP